MDQDWENRVLCDDGNCIGVIGSDGRCKECGKPYEGRLPEGFGNQASTPAPERSAQTQGEADDAQRPSTAEPDTAGQPAAAAGGDDWENRVLCSDGNCIGVIGSDGRCKECGKPYETDSTA